MANFGSSPSPSILRHLIDTFQDRLEHFNMNGLSVALTPFAESDGQYAESIMLKFSRDVRVWIVQTSSKNATLTVQSSMIPSLLASIHNIRQLDRKNATLTVESSMIPSLLHSDVEKGRMVTFFIGIILLGYAIYSSCCHFRGLVATFLPSMGLAKTIKELRPPSPWSSTCTFTPLTGRQALPNDDEVSSAEAIICGLRENLDDTQTVQESTAQAILTLNHALHQSRVGYEQAALASLDRSSPIASELRTALADREDAALQAQLARDGVAGCGGKKSRITDVERTLRDLRAQLEAQGIEKHSLREELKAIHGELRSLRAVARGQSAGPRVRSPGGTEALALAELRASTEAKTQALIELESSQQQLRTQRDSLERERFVLHEEVRVMQQRCEESEVAERTAARRAEEAMTRLATAEDNNTALLAATQQHGLEVGRLQTDLRAAEGQVLRAVMEGEEMHVKLLACEALLAPTAEERARWVGELSAKEEELGDARRLALTSQGANRVDGEDEGMGMVHTVLADCDTLLALIAAAKAKISNPTVDNPHAHPNSDSHPDSRIDPAVPATPGASSPPTPGTDTGSPSSQVLSNDVLSLRTKLQSLRQANRSLSGQYEAVKSHMQRQLEAAEQQQAEMEALQDVVRQQASWERQLRAVKEEAGMSEERIDQLETLLAQRERELADALLKSCQARELEEQRERWERARVAEREAVATTEAARRAAQEADKRALEEQLQRTLRERRDSSDEASALRSQLEALGAEAAAAHERKVTEVQTLRGAVDAAVADRGRLDEQYAALQADLAAATALAGQQGEELADVRCQLVESENQRQAAAMGCEFATTALRQAQQELNELRASSLAQCAALRAQLTAVEGALSKAEHNVQSLSIELEALHETRRLDQEALALAAQKSEVGGGSGSGGGGGWSAGSVSGGDPKSAQELRTMLDELRTKRRWLRDAMSQAIAGRDRDREEPGSLGSSLPSSLNSTPQSHRSRSRPLHSPHSPHSITTPSPRTSSTHSPSHRRPGRASPEVLLSDVYSVEEDPEERQSAAMLAATQLEKALMVDLRAIRQSKQALQTDLYLAGRQTGAGGDRQRAALVIPQPRRPTSVPSAAAPSSSSHPNAVTGIPRIKATATITATATATGADTIAIADTAADSSKTASTAATITSIVPKKRTTRAQRFAIKTSVFLSQATSGLHLHRPRSLDPEGRKGPRSTNASLNPSLSRGLGHSYDEQDDDNETMSVMGTVEGTVEGTETDLDLDLDPVLFRMERDTVPEPSSPTPSESRRNPLVTPAKRNPLLTASRGKTDAKVEGQGQDARDADKGQGLSKAVEKRRLGVHPASRAAVKGPFVRTTAAVKQGLGLRTGPGKE